MKICIDAREVREVETGVGRYALNLVRQIARIDTQNEYVVLHRASYGRPLVSQQNFREVAVPYGISTGRNIFRGAAVLNSLQVDIYHALFHLLPIGLRAKRVVITLHDLIWVNHPDIAYEAPIRRWMVHRFVGPLIGRSVEKADHVIAISESTRQDAVARYRVSDQKLTVIHHGVDASLCNNGVPVALPEACNGRRFIFSLGNTKPYKNIPRLIQAFSLIVRRYPDLFLLISGRGDGYPSLVQLARNLGVYKNVLFTGQLSDIEVQSCFANAVFFAFPSIIEGFGFPVIEAMANDCPVLTSNTSSLSEIAGNAAILVNPLDTASIASGMERLINDEVLRRELKAEGRKQAAQFKWQACAEKTLAVYRRLMNG